MSLIVLENLNKRYVPRYILRSQSLSLVLLCYDKANMQKWLYSQKHLAQSKSSLVLMHHRTYQASSATAERTDFTPSGPSTTAWLTSGYWEDEWLPQMMTFFTDETATPNRSATWPRALLWSSLVRHVMFFSGIEGANSFNISAFVFAGFATTRTCPWVASENSQICTKVE